MSELEERLNHLEKTIETWRILFEKLKLENDTSNSIIITDISTNDIRDNIKKWINKDELFTKLSKTKESNQIEKELLGIEHITWTNQWTTVLGETIVEYLLNKLFKSVTRPTVKNGLKPDFETEEFIFEVKTRNYTTNGTAGEKILGTPFKYCNVPELYGKPLIIVLVGYQELEAEQKFGLFNSNQNNDRKISIIKYYENMGIYYMKCSELLSLI